MSMQPLEGAMENSLPSYSTMKDTYCTNISGPTTKNNFKKNVVGGWRGALGADDYKSKNKWQLLGSYYHC